MAIRLYKAYTPGTRHRVSPNFSSLSNAKPEKSLLRTKNKKGEEIYHMMDVGGYSNISRKHPSIKILDIP